MEEPRPQYVRIRRFRGESYDDDDDNFEEEEDDESEEESSSSNDEDQKDGNADREGCAVDQGDNERSMAGEKAKQSQPSKCGQSCLYLTETSEQQQLSGAHEDDSHRARIGVNDSSVQPEMKIITTATVSLKDDTPGNEHGRTPALAAGSTSMPSIGKSEESTNHRGDKSHQPASAAVENVKDATRPSDDSLHAITNTHLNSDGNPVAYGVHDAQVSCIGFTVAVAAGDDKDDDNDESNIRYGSTGISIGLAPPAAESMHKEEEAKDDNNSNYANKDKHENSVHENPSASGHCSRNSSSHTEDIDTEGVDDSVPICSTALCENLCCLNKMYSVQKTADKYNTRCRSCLDRRLGRRALQLKRKKAAGQAKKVLCRKSTGGGSVRAMCKNTANSLDNRDDELHTKSSSGRFRKRGEEKEATAAPESMVCDEKGCNNSRAEVVYRGASRVSKKCRACLDAKQQQKRRIGSGSLRWLGVGNSEALGISLYGGGESSVDKGGGADSLDDEALQQYIESLSPSPSLSSAVPSLVSASNSPKRRVSDGYLELVRATLHHQRRSPRKKRHASTQGKYALAHSTGKGKNNATNIIHFNVNNTSSTDSTDDNNTDQTRDNHRTIDEGKRTSKILDSADSTEGSSTGDESEQTGDASSDNHNLRCASQACSHLRARAVAHGERSASKYCRQCVSRRGLRPDTDTGVGECQRSFCDNVRAVSILRDNRHRVHSFCRPCLNANNLIDKKRIRGWGHLSKDEKKILSQYKERKQKGRRRARGRSGAQSEDGDGADIGKGKGANQASRDSATAHSHPAQLTNTSQDRDPRCSESACNNPRVQVYIHGRRQLSKQCRPCLDARSPDKNSPSALNECKRSFCDNPRAQVSWNGEQHELRFCRSCQDVVRLLKKVNRRGYIPNKEEQIRLLQYEDKKQRKRGRRKRRQRRGDSGGDPGGEKSGGSSGDRRSKRYKPNRPFDNDRTARTKPHANDVTEREGSDAGSGSAPKCTRGGCSKPRAEVVYRSNIQLSRLCRGCLDHTNQKKKLTREKRRKKRRTAARVRVDNNASSSSDNGDGDNTSDNTSDNSSDSSSDSEASEHHTRDLRKHKSTRTSTSARGNRNRIDTDKNKRRTEYTDTKTLIRVSSPSNAIGDISGVNDSAGITVDTAILAPADSSSDYSDSDGEDVPLFAESECSTLGCKEARGRSNFCKACLDRVQAEQTYPRTALTPQLQSETGEEDERRGKREEESEEKEKRVDDVVRGAARKKGEEGLTRGKAGDDCGSDSKEKHGKTTHTDDAMNKHYDTNHGLAHGSDAKMEMNVDISVGSENIEHTESKDGDPNHAASELLDGQVGRAGSRDGHGKGRERNVDKPTRNDNDNADGNGYGYGNNIDPNRPICKEKDCFNPCAWHRTKANTYTKHCRQCLEWRHPTSRRYKRHLNKRTRANSLKLSSCPSRLKMSDMPKRDRAQSVPGTAMGVGAAVGTSRDVRRPKSNADAEADTKEGESKGMGPRLRLGMPPSSPPSSIVTGGWSSERLRDRRRSRKQKPSERGGERRTSAEGMIRVRVRRDKNTYVLVSINDDENGTLDDGDRKSVDVGCRHSSQRSGDDRQYSNEKTALSMLSSSSSSSPPLLSSSSFSSSSSSALAPAPASSNTGTYTPQISMDVFESDMPPCRLHTIMSEIFLPFSRRHHSLPNADQLKQALQQHFPSLPMSVPMSTSMPVSGARTGAGAGADTGTDTDLGASASAGIGTGVGTMTCVGAISLQQAMPGISESSCNALIREKSKGGGERMNSSFTASSSSGETLSSDRKNSLQSELLSPPSTSLQIPASAPAPTPAPAPAHTPQWQVLHHMSSKSPFTFNISAEDSTFAHFRVERVPRREMKRQGKRPKLRKHNYIVFRK